jgi:hypothetical protein
MTNKGVKSVLEPARNTAVMASPSADEHPADCPAALPQSLPLHPDHLFDPAPNAKTREAHKALRGFRSGCISPVDFVLMPQQKEQIKNFLKKLYIPPKAAPSGPVFILAHARS